MILIVIKTILKNNEMVVFLSIDKKMGDNFYNSLGMIIFAMFETID